MKPTERPKLEGPAASFLQKLGGIFGKPLKLPGEIAYHREDFAEVARQASLSDPLALARRSSRLFVTDHNKIDKLTNPDELYNEMDNDAVCGSAKQRYLEALQAATLTVDVDAEYEEYCASVTRPGKPLLEDTYARAVESETRGFVLAETIVERMERGRFAGYDTIGEMRRLERDSYRLQEDEFSKPELLELWVTDVAAYSKQQRALGKGHQRYIGTSHRPQTQVVIGRDDPDWARYRFLTYPERSNRTAGLGRYNMAQPWYWFLVCLRQWMMTLAERTGTPIIVAEWQSQDSLMGDRKQFQLTNDEMLAVLEKIQTNFRGLVPIGYSLKPLATGAEGLAALLQMLYTTCADMCEVAILGERVSSGGQAAGGTLGANQTIVNTTFGGHVAAGHKRIGGMLASSLEYLIELNFGRKVDVECSFEAVDPVKQAAKIANAQTGITIGAISKHEPWVRELLGAPRLDDKLLQETQAARSDAARFGLTETVGADAPISSSDTADTDKVLEIIDRLDAGDIGDALAATLLAKAMGVTAEEAARVVASEKARRAGEVAPIQATAEGGKVELTPSDLASITTVNEGRASAGLLPLPGPDGNLTIAEFVAKRAAAAEVTGDAAGKVSTGQAVTAQPAAQPAAFSDARLASNRVRAALGVARRYIRRDYDTSKPPPGIDSLVMAMGAFVPMADYDERKRRALVLRGQIQDALAGALAGVESDAEALQRFDEIAEFFTDPAKLEEFKDV